MIKLDNVSIITEDESNNLVIINSLPRNENINYENEISCLKNENWTLLNHTVKNSNTLYIYTYSKGAIIDNKTERTVVNYRFAGGPERLIFKDRYIIFEDTSDGRKIKYVLTKGNKIYLADMMMYRNQTSFRDKYIVFNPNPTKLNEESIIFFIRDDGSIKEVTLESAFCMLNGDEKDAPCVMIQVNKDSLDLMIFNSNGELKACVPLNNVKEMLHILFKEINIPGIKEARRRSLLSSKISKKLALFLKDSFLINYYYFDKKHALLIINEIGVFDNEGNLIHKLDKGQFAVPLNKTQILVAENKDYYKILRNMSKDYEDIIFNMYTVDIETGKKIQLNERCIKRIHINTDDRECSLDKLLFNPSPFAHEINYFIGKATKYESFDKSSDKTIEKYVDTYNNLIVLPKHNGLFNKAVRIESINGWDIINIAVHDKMPDEEMELIAKRIIYDCIKNKGLDKIFIKFVTGNYKTKKMFLANVPYNVYEKISPNNDFVITNSIMLTSFSRSIIDLNRLKIISINDKETFKETKTNIDKIKIKKIDWKTLLKRNSKEVLLI